MKNVEKETFTTSDQAAFTGLDKLSANVNNIKNTQPKQLVATKECVIEQVYAYAELINSKEPTVSKEEVSSLIGVLKGKDHLKRNIRKIARYDFCDTTGGDDGTFIHGMPLVLDVDISQLWENPRSYIYHHLGRDCWKLSNGTTIRLTRIHQK